MAYNIANPATIKTTIIKNTSQVLFKLTKYDL